MFTADLDACQRRRTPPDQLKAEDFVSLLELEWAASQVKSGCVGRWVPAATAKHPMPIALKAKRLLCEPVHSEGGKIWNSYKGRGPQHFRKSFRGIRLSDRLLQCALKGQEAEALAICLCVPQL